MFTRKGPYHFLFGALFVFLCCASAAAEPFRGLSDTTEKSTTIRFLTRDSAEIYARYLLSSHPVFTDHWNTNAAFVFDDINKDELPNDIVLSLLGPEEQFKLTWYGRITSTYKKRWGRQHHGLDIDLETGDTVMAAFDGVVRYAQYNRSGFGNCVIIRHMNGLETIYAHLSKIDVEPNEFVSSGQHIGLGGNTGHSKGSHLHFETRYKDFSFDPLLFIDIETQSLKSNILVLHPSDFNAYRKKSRSSQNAIKSGEVLNLTDSNNLVTSIEPEEVDDNVCSVPESWLAAVNEHTAAIENAKKTAANFNSKRNASKRDVKSKANDKKGSKTYTIKSGDNLGFISEKTGVPVSKLRKLNVIKSDRKLMPGQVLRLN